MLAGINAVSFLLLIVVSQSIGVTANVILRALSYYLSGLFMSLHLQVVLVCILVGISAIYYSYFSFTNLLRILGIVMLLGIPVTFHMAIYFGYLTQDPFYIMAHPLLVEIVLIYATVIVGIVNVVIGRELIDSYQCTLEAFSIRHRVKIKNLLVYLAIIVCLIAVTFIGVFLDVINTLGVTGNPELTYWGYTATKQEWFQNLFLVGFITILIPAILIVGFFAGKQGISFIKLIILIATVYPLISAFWDILFYYLFVIPSGIPADTFVAWFDPFNLALQPLGTIILEQGFIAMDVEGMLYFAYIRLLIFVPLLAYELYKWSQETW
jgi:hypothetical protein